VPADLPPPPFKATDLPAWLAIAFGWTVARWPWWLARRAGRVLGAVMRTLMIARGAIAAKNLALCYPELSDTERRALWHASFDSLGVSVFEFLRAWWGPLTPLDRGVEIIGVENLRAAQAGGRGVILISPHLTTLEICVRLLSREVAVAGMYRPHESPPLEWAVKRGRLRYTLAMYSREELRPALRHLKSGGVLWFAPDQETRRGESVFVPFFGQPAWSLTSTHQLARLSGAAVLTLFYLRRPDGGYRIEIGPPLPHFPSTDATADTARVMAAMEALIRRAPEQYLWVHDRFKKRQEGGRDTAEWVAMP
jgi:Kdo2-lipid IVA lauroyltransferase/acyltransferase